MSETNQDNITNPALVQLRGVESNIIVPDMNYQFCYQRVRKPNQNDSKLFALHYKENSQLDWSTSRNLLSESFTVAKTEIIIDQIRDNLNGNIIKQKTNRSDTTVKSMFILSGYELDIEDDSDMNKILFKLITGIDSGTNLLANNQLSFNVINGFSGNHALQLNFGILKTMHLADTPNISVNNIFLLDRHTIRLVHNNRLNINISDVTNVQRNITVIINEFRNNSFGSDILNRMISVFPKRFTKRVCSLWEMVPTELRNFYYMTYILSSCLEEENKINLEISLRLFIATALQDEISRSERAMTDLSA